MTKTSEQGLSLLDIGPISENVRVGNALVKVYGVSAKGIFTVFQRFPEVGTWFKGGKIADLRSLVNEVPDAIAAVIAAGCGFPGDEKAEAVAGAWPVEAQLDVLEAIGRLTFKAGFGPFVSRIVALSEQAQSLNFGRGAATTSPPTSKPASPPASTPSSPGISRPAK